MSESMEAPAEALARLGRHWGWVLAYGLITLIAGILALAWPSVTLLVIAVLFGGLAVILGIWLVIFGVMETMLAFRLRRLGHTVPGRVTPARTLG